MLTRIDLRNFKCFGLLKLPLAPLTLLSGTNASGKSSVIQALALLNQTIHIDQYSSHLFLNGPIVRLGTVYDVVNQIHGRDSFEMSLYEHEEECNWVFEGARGSLSMPISRVNLDDKYRLYREEDAASDNYVFISPSNSNSNSNDGDTVSSQAAFWRLLPLDAFDKGSGIAHRLEELTYLTAERLGPRETYLLEDPQIASAVGPKGEHTLSLLHSGRDAVVRDSLVMEGAPPMRLRQIEAHMGRFFPGFELRVDEVPQVNALTLGIRTSRTTDFHRPIHTGFGITQVLPIVVSALSSDQGGLLLIENPEVHLHPAGQVTMGEFLAQISAAGVQVVLETHSDHVLNGVRRAVKEGAIEAEKVALHFFSVWDHKGSESDDAIRVQTPILRKDGSIDHWPRGFFDQFDKDMSYFAGWG